MKNKSGISLISLIVTIIVLVLITSITIYTGGNMIDQSRIRNAKDRLMTIASAIVSHEEELGFADVVVSNESGDFRLLGVDDYEIMGLEDYKNDTQMPPIYVYKSGDSLNSNKKEYILKTPKTVKIDNKYDDDDFVYITHTFYDGTNRENLKVEFDTVKGVNRPLLTADMMPIRTYFNDEGDVVYSEPVEDIYDEDWYDYSIVSPNWANIKMNDSIYYVWIPRFAYKVEDFYAGTNLSNIPASAIKVIFLKGVTDYMANDELLPAGYQVHPAFKYYSSTGEVINIPGFWVAKHNVNNLVDVLYKDSTEDETKLSALEEVELTNLHGTSNSIVNQLESHLIKNTEWAAVAYLSFATTGKTNDGTSLNNNPSAVMDLNIKQFVAGALDSTLQKAIGNGTLMEEEVENFDKYFIQSGDMLKYETLEDKQHGDAMAATSVGNSNQSTWFGGRSIKISEDNPFIIRGVDNCLFSYSSEVRNPTRGAGCRNVLIVKSDL